MFEQCGNCGARVVKGVRDDLGVFCSMECRNFKAYPGFCPACLNTTNSRSSGGTFTFNGIGTALYGSRDPCAVCGSVIQTLWFCIIFVPVIPLGKYRVKHTQPRKWVSRQFTGVASEPLPAPNADIQTLRRGLHSPSADVREECASRLGDRGVDALAALPELEQLSADPDRRARMRAKWAVETIRDKAKVMTVPRG